MDSDAKVISNTKILDSSSYLTAVGSSQLYFSVFSRFLYLNESLSVDNFYSNTPNNQLNIKGIMIHSKDSIYSLYNEHLTNIMILGEVDYST